MANLKTGLIVGIIVICGTSSMRGAVTFTNTSSAIAVSNGNLSFNLSKSNGQVTSIKLNNHELVGNGGKLYADLNDSLFGFFGIGSSDAVATTFTVKTGSDWVDAVVTHNASATLPFSISQHYVMRNGETGIHLITEYDHKATDAADTLIQSRVTFRGDPNIFNYHSVTDDRFGIMPTPANLTAAPAVQDATDDLQGLNSVYPKRYYTKYDWSAYEKDTDVRGMVGGGYGAWIVQGVKESTPAGPLKQNLTVHQEVTPVLLAMNTSGHYGSSSVDATGDWTKVYSPQFLYFNTGTDLATMRNNAKQFATPTFDQPLYDSLGIAGYTPSNQRSHVQGKVNLPANVSMAGAMVILSENNLNWQKMSKGYNYWTTASTDGSFDLSNVRAGTYRVSVYRDGYFGEYTQDNVVVGAASTAQIGNQTWAQPATNGTKVFQIGHPDRTAAEFKHGDDYHNYWGTFDYPTEFPNGVDYHVGTSKPRNDWNYVQWRTWNSANQPDWKVNFNLAKSPGSGTATLTVALAAAQSSLSVFVNGYNSPNRFDWAIASADASGNVARRSGISGQYLLHEFQIPMSLLKSGDNAIYFHIGDNVLYDAIRLELPGFNYASGDINGDGGVDITDLQVLANNWRLDGGLLQGDVNNDAFIDASDLNILRANWQNQPSGQTFEQALTIVGLPEPGAITLLVPLLAVGGRRGRSMLRI